MIVYSSTYEVIVCEVLDEQQMLVDYFGKGGRVLENFDREETGTFQIFPNIRCDLTVPGVIIDS